MSLDVTRLEKARTLGGGAIQARCPACAENGGDRSGEHLRVYPDGRFGCCVHPEDKEHRKRIFALADGKVEPRRPLPSRSEPNLPRPDFRKLIETWSEATHNDVLDSLADYLGVAVWALGALGCCFSSSHGAYAFPMSDERGEVIGVRLRYESGEKRAVLGSRNGLFIPDMEPERRVFVCEGPTDLAACLSLGLWGVARPSCSACGPMLSAFLARHRVREAVILADNDKPGIDGAERLELPCISTVLLTPCKDVREFTSLGGTRAQLESSLRGVVWRQPA